MIYLDNASTTMTHPDVVEAMMPYITNSFANPGSIHAFGRECAQAVYDARCKVASLINAEPENIIFTSGGSESNTLALIGVMDYLKRISKHLVLGTNCEHKSVLIPMERMRREGFDCRLLPVGQDGVLQPGTLAEAINDQVGLVSIMGMNNELGTKNDLHDLGKICRKHNALFHTDCVQALDVMSVDVSLLDVDFVSMSAHKIHGPKGVGALYVRDLNMLNPIILGGSQEFGLRAGTENVPGIIGFGKAAELCKKEAPILPMWSLVYYIKSVLKEAFGDIVHFNGNSKSKVVNVRFDGIDGETLVLALSNVGVMVSAGAACNSHNSEPSHVLKAIGLTDEEARSSIRISISSDTTNEAVVFAMLKIVNTVRDLLSIT